MRNKKQICEDGIARITSPLAIHFARKVMELRESMDMKQATLAKRAGINVTYLSEVERIKKEPGLAIAGKIADALGLELWQMLPGAETVALEYLPVENQPKEEK